MARSVINYANGNASCIGKLVLLPNYALNAQIICDINFNSYLCIYNQQTNQYNCIGNIIFEPSGEYAVYQSYQKVCMLCYHSFEDLVWRFVPLGAAMQQQSQGNQYTVPNVWRLKYTFNNVPPEQADGIIRNIMEHQLQNPVEVNFASPVNQEVPL